MATGTSGGLLDDPEGHAQSVFKHAILRRYMLPFVAMVGARRRVDGWLCLTDTRGAVAIAVASQDQQS